MPKVKEGADPREAMKAFMNSDSMGGKAFQNSDMREAESISDAVRVPEAMVHRDSHSEMEKADKK